MSGREMLACVTSPCGLGGLTAATRSDWTPSPPGLDTSELL